MHHVAVAALVPPSAAALELVRGTPLTLVAPGDLVGGAAALASTGAHVLLLGEQRHEPLVRRAAALLHDHGLPVAWRAVPHGPDAVLLMASQVAAAGVDAGTAVAFSDHLAAQTWSGAWTPSVAKLEHPRVSVGQHLNSWLPGGPGYVVTFSGPEPAVQKVGREIAPALPVVPRGALYGTGVARLKPAARVALSTVSGGGDAVELSSLAVDPLGRIGSPHAVELVALPATDQLELPASRGACGVCGALVFTDFCPFCHVRPLAAEPRGALA